MKLTPNELVATAAQLFTLRDTQDLLKKQYDEKTELLKENAEGSSIVVPGCGTVQVTQSTETRNTGEVVYKLNSAKLLDLPKDQIDSLINLGVIESSAKTISGRSSVVKLLRDK